MATEQTVHPDGRVELASHAEIEESSLYNHDLAPVRIADRKWTKWDYGALWVSMAHCIPTYMMAGAMIDDGMSWWQALFTILLANLIVLVPILLNSHPGTKYGIPFPVFARAAYGTRGANLPALLRAVVACGWFGIQAWIGGMALQTFFVSIWPGWATALGTIRGYPGTQWIAFLLFWALNILIVYRGMELLRRVERWAAPFVLVATAALVYWAISNSSGLGAILSRPGKLDGFGAFWPVFIPHLTATIAFWSTLSLNMPDFTRYSRSQRDQVIGQSIALPSTMTIFAGMGLVVTTATAIIYGKALWNPLDLAATFDNRLVVALVTFTAVVATLSVNIAANVVSPANDFANAFPKKVNFKTGGLITGIVGILMQPWKLLEDPATYISKWLNGYGGALGSIAGVLIVDYWIIRKRNLVLRDLYLDDGAYHYTQGWNLPAVIATLLGAAIALCGMFVPALHVMSDWSWFIGFFLAASTYYLLMRTRRSGGSALPEARVT